MTFVVKEENGYFFEGWRCAAEDAFSAAIGFARGDFSFLTTENEDKELSVKFRDKRDRLLHRQLVAELIFSEISPGILPNEALELPPKFANGLAQFIFHWVVFDNRARGMLPEDYRRLHSAGVEGLLYGIAKWDYRRVKENKSALAALIGHLIFWINGYVANEAMRVDGERRGAIYEASLRFRASASNYSFGTGPLKAIRAIKRALESTLCREPRMDEVLAELPKRVLAVINKNVELIGSESVEFTDLAFAAIDYVFTLDFIDHASFTGALGRLGWRHSDLDGLDILKKAREQLMLALEVCAQAGTIELSAQYLALVDLLYFYCLPLEDNNYSVSLEDNQAKIACMRETLAHIDSSDDRFRKQWARRISQRIAELEQESDVVSIRVPSLSRSSSYGSKFGPGAPEEWSSFLAFKPRLYNHRVAYCYCRRFYGVVTVECFVTALKTISRIRSDFESFGFFKPESRNSLPVIREWKFLADGWAPAAQYNPDGKPLYLENGRPMIAWERPTDFKRESYRFPFMQHTRVDSGACIEDLRLEKEKEKETEKLVSLRRLERRKVFIPCRKDENPTLTLQRVSGKFHKKTVYRFFKEEERVLPRVNVTVGHRREPGSQVSVGNLAPAIQE